MLEIVDELAKICDDPGAAILAGQLIHEGYDIHGFVLRKQNGECAIVAQHSRRSLTFDQLFELVNGTAGDLFVIEAIQAKLFKLEEAIKKHRKATRHEMCWQNDEELWAVLEDRIKIDHTPPPWCEFMQKCAEYRASKDGQRTQQISPENLTE